MNVTLRPNDECSMHISEVLQKKISDNRKTWWKYVERMECRNIRKALDSSELRFTKEKGINILKGGMYLSRNLLVCQGNLSGRQKTDSI
jgi:hypothetical protein